MKRLIAACAATLSLALAGPASAAPAKPQGTTVPTPQRFTVEVIGKGPDVILIPGLMSPREVWRAEAERLKARHRVHLVQIRGFGDDAGINASGPVLAPFVAELGEYIVREKLHKPAVVGHSLGGLAALMLGADKPELPGRIMAVDALPFFPVLFDPAATVQSAAPQAEQMKAAILARGKDWKAPLTRPDCSAATGLAPLVPGAMSRTMAGQCLVRGWGAASDPRVGAQAMADDMTTDLREAIAKIAVPLTVVYAADSRIMPDEGFAALYRTNYAKAAAVRLVPVADSLHFVMLDQPTAFAAAMNEFLR